MDKKACKWLEDPGPQQEIVLSTRIRLARNIATLPFPQVAKPQDLAQVASQVRQAAENIQGPWGKLHYQPLEELGVLQRKSMVAKHLISPQLAQEAENRGVLLSPEQELAVMVNEEDHLRIQVLLPGLDLDRAWALASQLDDSFEESLDFAFSEEHGYLTACPTNVGTGIRASVMVHLPAITMVNQIKQLIHGVTQVGLAVRGLYGEGTEVVGNIYQLSNQVTLGRTEAEIIENIRSVTGQILEQEQQARGVLLGNAKAQIEDRVYRAYGILTQARILSTQEAMSLLSDLRLGVGLGLIGGISYPQLNQLVVTAQPSAVQGLMERELDPQQRDYYRAALIRERLGDKAREKGENK